ncbi:unnamed protein product [Parajaminaea phylloscopi]
MLATLLNEPFRCCRSRLTPRLGEWGAERRPTTTRRPTTSDTDPKSHRRSSSCRQTDRTRLQSPHRLAPHPHSNCQLAMAAASVIGWAGLGFVTRCYQLGLQKRNMFDNFGGHAALMTIFGGIGYWAHGLQERQEKLIEQKKEQILRNRERVAQRQQEQASHEE